MTDACLSGFAVGEGDLGSKEMKNICEWEERWRFKRRSGAELAPRARVLARGAELFDVASVLPAVEGEILGEAELVEGFPDVPTSVLKHSRWHVLYAHRLRFAGPVHLKEGLGVLSAVKHRSRDSLRHGGHELWETACVSLWLWVREGPLTVVCYVFAEESLLNR